MFRGKTTHKKERPKNTLYEPKDVTDLVAGDICAIRKQINLIYLLQTNKNEFVIYFCNMLHYKSEEISNNNLEKNDISSKLLFEEISKKKAVLDFFLYYEEIDSLSILESSNKKHLIALKNEGLLFDLLNKKTTEYITKVYNDRISRIKKRIDKRSHLSSSELHKLIDLKENIEQHIEDIKITQIYDIRHIFLELEFKIILFIKNKKNRPVPAQNNVYPLITKNRIINSHILDKFLCILIVDSIYIVLPTIFLVKKQ